MNFVVGSSRGILSSSSLEIPIFAVIAMGDDIISYSGNRVEELKNPLMHAEYISVITSLQKLKTKYLDEMSLYVNLEPCCFCASVLEKVRIQNIFFGAYDPKCGGIEHNARIFDSSLHKPKNIIGGIRESECSNIIKEFFKKLR